VPTGDGSGVGLGVGLAHFLPLAQPFRTNQSERFLGTAVLVEVGLVGQRWTVLTHGRGATYIC